MKESVLKTDKNIVFKETFGSEDLVRRNGGTPTAVTFANGVGSFLLSSSSRISYNKIFSGTGSVRIKCKPTSFATTQVLFDFRDYTATPSGADLYLNATTGQIIYQAAVGTIYNRGIPSTTSYLNSDNDIVITGISLSNLRFTIGSNYAALFNFTGSIELLEIYKGTLTANEVKNLYENRQNREINTSQTLQASTTELIVNANDRNFESGTTGNWNGSYKSSSFAASTEQKYSGSYSMKYVSDGTGQGEVRLSNTANNLVAANTEGGYTTAWIYSSHAGVYLGAKGIGVTSYFSSASTTINGWQQLSVFVPDGVVATNSYVIFFNVPSGATVYFDDISWKKTLNNTTKEILRVDARNGVIANKYSGNTYDELVTDPSIETATWTGYNAPATSARSSEQAHSGTYSWKLTTNDVNQGASNNNPSTVVFTSGKVYRISAFVYPTSTMNVVISARNGGSTIGSSTFTSLTANTWNSLVFNYTATTTTTTGNLAIYSNLAGQTFYIDDVSVKEVIPSVTPPAVSVVRSGNVYAMDFNGSTSKIDCGSYDTLVGNKTFVLWYKMKSINASASEQDIFTNTYARLFYNNNSTTILLFSSTGGSPYCGATTPDARNSWSMYVITRTSTGITNIFRNGDLLSIANVATNTPIAGGAIQLTSTPKPTNGQASNFRIYDGILSTQEIAQLWQNEKSLYNL